MLNPRQSQLVYQVWTHDKYNTERFVDNIKIHLATTTQQPSAESKFGHVSCVRVSYGLFRTNHFWTRIRFTLIEIRRDSFEMLKPARWENAVCERFSRFLRDSMKFFRTDSVLRLQYVLVPILSFATKNFTNKNLFVRLAYYTSIRTFSAYRNLPTVWKKYNNSYMKIVTYTWTRVYNANGSICVCVFSTFDSCYSNFVLRMGVIRFRVFRLSKEQFLRFTVRFQIIDFAVSVSAILYVNRDRLKS